MRYGLKSWMYGCGPPLFECQERYGGMDVSWTNYEGIFENQFIAFDSKMDEIVDG